MLVHWHIAKFTKLAALPLTSTLDWWGNFWQTWGEVYAPAPRLRLVTVDGRVNKP